MKTQIAVACLAVLLAVASVTAYDTLRPVLYGSVTSNIRDGLQRAYESKNKVHLIVEQKAYEGVPTNLSDDTVTLQGNEKEQRLLMRLDRINGVVLLNSAKQQQAADEIWDTATMNANLSSWAVAHVSGTVTFDGEPLSGAEIRYYFAGDEWTDDMTDDDGRYSLYLRRGNGELGETRVRFYWPKGTDGPFEIPNRYGRGSLLTADVREGKNVFDFELQPQ